jgi:hypothetical protein
MAIQTLGVNLNMLLQAETLLSQYLNFRFSFKVLSLEVRLKK